MLTSYWPLELEGVNKEKDPELPEALAADHRSSINIYRMEKQVPEQATLARILFLRILF
jgi:hypothetical protein